MQGNFFPIPAEILYEQHLDPTPMLEYFFRKSRDNSLLDAKILVVGQGFVGKTSIINRILHNEFNKNQPKTEGITIDPWSIEYIWLDEPYSSQVDQAINIKFWDFGGQEIMHATHQFFLTRRSLYLLVLDSRLTQEENRVEYWLKIIQSFGGESPVLVVGNKIDQHPLDIDRSGLQKKYSNIVSILETSAATGVGIVKLKDEIKKTSAGIASCS